MPLASLGRPDLWPIAVPCGLLVAGGLLGYPFSLDQPVALERLLGLIVGSAVAIVTFLGMRCVRSPARWLAGVAVTALAAALWVIAASGPDVFRGSVGVPLRAVFGPMFGLVQITDPVEVTNTRFIVGYNGLADVCLVAIFSSGALLLGRPERRWRGLALIGAIVVSLVLLVGAGGRGGLTGLAAGICLAGTFAWPRRYALLTLLAAPAALAVAALGILDKGLEFSSTAGRLMYWGDLARLLVEYPLTGVGLGVDTANTMALQYEIDPDPERVFYAHNTFVQSYLEQGPLGFVGMVAVVVVAVAAALLARRCGAVSERRALLLTGLAVLGGLEAHGLTDQVLTTNGGTLLVLVGLAAILASLSYESLSRLGRLVRGSGIVLGGLTVLGVAYVVLTPIGKAQALLDLGGLKMNQALLVMDPDSADRAATLGDAEATLTAALSQDSGHPAVLRDLALVRSARFDDAGAFDALQRAAASPRIDAFDMLQIAHGYRELGFADEAYRWASRAYVIWGRSFEDAVMQRYAQSTLTDARARTLADQAEAAMRYRHFGEAHTLFQQASTFDPTNTYLQDRIGAAQRAIDKYGPGPSPSERALIL